VLELLSLGGSYRVAGPFLPWHWLQGLPVFAELIPDRLAILADGAAAAVLAFALDRARQEAHCADWRRGHLATAVAVLAVLPLIPLPYAVAEPAPVPAGWPTALARLHLAPDARVLVVPIPDNHFSQPMRWQAVTGEPASMIGGFFLGPNQSGQTKVSPGAAGTDAQYLDPLWTGKAPSVHRSLAQLRADVAYWHLAAVIDVLRGRSRLGPVLTALFGHPSFKVGRLLVWRL
jgi:hypothetical protein